MKILVPTDFSKLSKVAVIYAAELASKLNANITILSVLNTPSAGNSVELKKWKKLNQEIEEDAQKDMTHLIDELNKEIKERVICKSEYIRGFPIEDKIEEYVVNNDIDMIVIGTKGATGLKSTLLGSNAAAVIDNSSVPVLAIPAGVLYKGIHKIVYATDMEHIEDEIKIVATLAKLVNASVHVLHIMKNTAKEKINKNEEARIINIAKYTNITFHITKGDSITEEVNHFVEEHQPDMLALFTHKLDFYEKLFGKSITRQLAFHSKIPLLSFNKTLLA